jgi:hypothetical protein
MVRLHRTHKIPTKIDHISTTKHDLWRHEQEGASWGLMPAGVPPEGQHVHHVHLAEVSEVMLANQVACCLLHGWNVQRPAAATWHNV